MEKLNPDQVERAIKKMPKVDQAVVKLLQDHEKLEKQLASANAKLEAIKKALPLVPLSWGSGPRAFVDKVRSIIESP